jgi:hypothetical protein
VRGTPEAASDPFALNLDEDARLKGLYYDAEHEDGYFRDQGVFSEGITAEDDMAVLVRYASGATMSYHLTAYSPWEGLHVMFNGTHGRLELSWEESSFNALPDGSTRERENLERLGITDWEPAHYPGSPQIVLRNQWSKPVKINVPYEKHGHGGGDARLLGDIFGDKPEHDPLRRAAGHRDGAMSILTGIAANKSFETGQPVNVAELVRL